MYTIKKIAPIICLVFGLFALNVQQAQAQERLCDTAFEDCRQPLWDLIDHETVRIDVSFWFIQDTSLSNKLIARFQAGVPVRILCDPRASATYAGNQQILDQLRAAGIPMRYKVADCILHMKFMLFAGQNKLEFSGANYGPFFFVPNIPYQDYIDEAIYFTDDPSVINSFKTQMDNLWTDTVNYGNYGNITGPLTRVYPTSPIDPALNFPPTADGSQDYYGRTAFHLNHESQKIDIIMYRITNDRYTNDTVNAANRGVPVRLITEQDEYRNPARQWDAYNVDLLYNAGVQIKIRAHQGLNHEKVLMLYGQGMTIFGSSNWTGPSSNCQQENNYFTTKPWFFNWFVSHFDRKWNSTSETQPFVPLPPDQPAYQSPANNATGQQTTLNLTWEGGNWAHKFDIYFGTDPNPPLLAADQFIGKVDNGVPETYKVQALQPGTKYFWRIVSKTMANVTASGPIRNFTTAGIPGAPPTVTGITPNSGTTLGGTNVTITGTNFATGATVTIGGAAATSVNVASGTSITATTPSHTEGTVDVVVRNADNQTATLANGFTFVAPSTTPPGPGDVVLYASEASVKVGSWQVVADPTAAGGSRLFNPDAGQAKVAIPAANPTSYFEMTFTAQAGTPYHMWFRSKALNDNPFNDSVHIQYSDSVDQNGAATYRIGTTTSTEMNLEECSGCGLSGWGWQDNGWGGVGVLGLPIYFQTSGQHTIRVQVREDGISIDQIVLSKGTYLSASPGAAKNDTTILGKSEGGPAAAPMISGISPASGSVSGGTSVTISGSNYASGASVSIGGVTATSVNVVNSSTITAITGAHAAGVVDVVVANSDGQSATLPSGFTYVTNPTPPAPAVTTVSPNSGSNEGGTVVTISGTGFVTGATVRFGGVAATSVNVTSSTSITATSPAHDIGSVDVVVTNPDGQSGTSSNGFSYALPIMTETILLADDFNDNALNSTKWAISNLFSGFTDAGLPTLETNQRLEIGPMLQQAGGSHYNGL
ncbi:MAG: IPT/TIG domain-containing protein, partial [Blastocatellia bacterium]